MKDPRGLARHIFEAQPTANDNYRRKGVLAGGRAKDHALAEQSAIRFLVSAYPIPEPRGELPRAYPGSAKGGQWQGQGGLCGFYLRSHAHNTTVDRKGVVGHVIVLRLIGDDFTKQAAKLFHGGSLSRTYRAGVQDRPSIGFAFHSACGRSCKVAALKGLQRKIPAVERENIVVLDRIEHPIRESDLTIKHASLARLLHDLGRVTRVNTLKYSLPPYRRPVSICTTCRRRRASLRS